MKVRKKRPEQTGQLIGVRLQPDDLAALDAIIASRPEPKPSRPEAIRQIVQTTLRLVKGKRGTPSSKPTGPATDAVKMMDAAINEHENSIPVEDLNSSNDE